MTIVIALLQKIRCILSLVPRFLATPNTAHLRCVYFLIIKLNFLTLDAVCCCFF